MKNYWQDNLFGRFQVTEGETPAAREECLTQEGHRVWSSPIFLSYEEGGVTLER
jgi:hypothetical protein